MFAIAFSEFIKFTPLLTIRFYRWNVVSVCMELLRRYMPTYRDQKLALCKMVERFKSEISIHVFFSLTVNSEIHTAPDQFREEI